MIKTNVMRILEKEKVFFESYEYPHGKEAVDGVTVAKLLSQDPKTVFKTLVTTDGKKDYYVFVIPVEKELDLKKAANAVGEKSIEMIKSKELLPLTGYVHGGCSPIGMKKSFKTFVHETAKDFDTIVFSAGKIGCQVQLDVKDLEKMIRLGYADLVI